MSATHGQSYGLVEMRAVIDHARKKICAPSSGTGGNGTTGITRGARLCITRKKAASLFIQNSGVNRDGLRLKRLAVYAAAVIADILFSADATGEVLNSSKPTLIG
jgi:hypothetical protein